MLVRTSTSDVRDSAVITRHTHDWHQLIYVRSGLMSVATTTGSWIAPPTWAVWVPAGVGHAIRFVGDSALRTVYLKTTDGKTVKVKTGDSTKITLSGTGKAKDLKSGASIVVRGETASDGTVTATTVTEGGGTSGPPTSQNGN